MDGQIVGIARQHALSCTGDGPTAAIALILCPNHH